MKRMANLYHYNVINICDMQHVSLLQLQPRIQFKLIFRSNVKGNIVINILLLYVREAFILIDLIKEK